MLGALLRLLRRGPEPIDPRVVAREEAEQIVQRAEQEARERLLAAQEQSLEHREQVDAEVRGIRAEIQRSEDRLIRREETLESRDQALEQRDSRLKRRRDQLDEREREIEQHLSQREREIEQHLSERERKLEELTAEEQARLEKVSNLTIEEARERLLEQVESEISDEAGRLVRQAERRVREESDERARDIVATAIQRVASDVTRESTVYVVPLPSEDIKGRIIGREGRNIRALEIATGCDLIIDDTPDAVMISGFDPVRREVGRLSLSRLVADGRIHPARIEEQVAKAQRDVDAIVRESGDEAAIEAHCSGLPSGLLDIFGRLRFRTSYGQNQLRHAVETAHIAAMIADDIKADVDIARRGALLHDIGKSIDHEVEGTHALIGGDLARRFKMPEPIAHCIEAHHDEVELQSIEAIIVQIADAISGGRPGARRESTDRYIERLRALEEIATSYPGVDQAFAIQAGREVRVVVNPEEVDDLGAMRLARDISKQIEENLQYPGQVRVTVMRETRVAEYAR